MSIDRDEETGQTIISAVGEAQVSVLLNRLEDRTKVVARACRSAFRIARPFAVRQVPRAAIEADRRRRSVRRLLAARGAAHWARRHERRL